MKTTTKVKIVITFIIILLLVIFILIIKSIKNTIFNDTLRKETENIIQEKKLNMDDDYVDIIRTTAEKNADWSNLPLSKSFRKKYKQKSGILNDDKITYLSVRSGNVNNKEDQIVVLIVDHGAKNEDYYIHYTLNDQNELDDVEIVDKKLLYDEEGNEVIYKETMAGAFISNIISLAAPWRLEYDPFDYICVTDNYLKKWGGKGFIPGFDIEIENHDNAYVSIDYYDNLCDKEKQEVYFNVEYTYIENDGKPDAKLACDYIKYFKVNYSIDKNAWLDDVKVEEVSKEEIDRLLEENGK